MGGGAHNPFNTRYFGPIVRFRVFCVGYHDKTSIEDHACASSSREE
jgi:hypothetical protein